MKTGKIVCIIICLLAGLPSLQAQDKLNVTVRNDSVFNGEKFEFFAISRTNPTQTVVLVRAPDSSLQAILYMAPADDKIKFIGKFNKLNKMYGCLYPKLEPVTIYESYIRNGVMVDGKATLTGLQGYCNERKLELTEIPKRKVVTPGVNSSDSLLKARAEEKMKSMVKIQITNTSKQPVTVMSGMPATAKSDSVRSYSEKREDIFAPGEEKTFIAFKEEVICIIAPDHTEKDCHPVTPALKSLSIAVTGDKFGK